MPTPTWTDIPNSDLDVNSPGKQAIFQELRDNDVVQRQCVVAVLFDEVTATETSYTTKATVYVPMPDFPDATDWTRQIQLDLWLKTSGGTGYFEAYCVEETLTSTEVTTSSTSYVAKTVAFSGFSGTAPGTTLTIQLKLKATSGQTTSAKNDNLCTARIYY